MKRFLALALPLALAACGGTERTTAPVVDGPAAVTDEPRDAVQVVADPVAAASAGIAPGADAEPFAVPEAALAAIDSAAIARRLSVLAADDMEGRGTGTPGEARAVAYIAEQMKAAGLAPGAPDGSFFQPVPLRGYTLSDVSKLTLAPAAGDAAEVPFVEGFIVESDRDTTAIAVDAPLVFVGYGIENAGYDWDDYKGADVRGKIIVSFVNDPPAPAAEPNLFQADTLTYNGRWTYKYEEARRRGALGALLIHTTPTAGYPFIVLSGGARGRHIELAEEPQNPLAVKGWITQPVAERLAGMAGMTLDQWFDLAATRDFRPVELPVRAKVSFGVKSERFAGTNVIGKLAGHGAGEEAIVYTAHHDHLGKNEELIAKGEDGIYNGAVDNASGTAMLLTIAEAFTRLPEPPRRTVLFATLTAEESGLLGSAHYARNPVVPLAQTIANLNVDSGNLDGRTEDIVGIGAERSELLDLLRGAAAAEDMRVTPDNQPNQGLFFRSDQLAFARGGVPAVFFNEGSSYIGQPADYAARVQEEYRQTRYHRPADEYRGTEPMGGAVQQARVAFRLGYRLATTDLRPQWLPSEAFAQTRRASEAAAGLR